jgi:type VI secretion system secreted protein Hcp
MAADCILVMDQVSGESEDAEFAGGIEVASWRWGAKWVGAAMVTGRSRGGAGELRHFVFEHYLDTASPGLFSRCMGGRLVPNAKLIHRRAGGDETQKAVLITFTNLRIVEVDLVFAEARLAPVETVTLAFETVSYDYSRQSSKGSGKGANVFTWRADSAS